MKKLIFNFAGKGLLVLFLTSSSIYSSAITKDMLVPEERALEIVKDGSARIIINYYNSSAIKELILQENPQTVKIPNAIREYILSEYSFIMAHRGIPNRAFFKDNTEYDYDVSSNKWKRVNNNLDKYSRKEAIVVASYFEGRKTKLGHPFNDADESFEYFIASNFDRNNRIILNVPDDCEDILDYQIEKILKRQYGERLVEVVGQKKAKSASFLSLRNFSVSLCMIIVAYIIYKRS